MTGGSQVLKVLSAQSAVDEYRRRINVRKVLDHYGVENDYEETTPSGETEVIHSCLLDRVDRHHNNGDVHPSASANLDRKLYICYSYWGGDILGLVQKMEDRRSVTDTLPLVAQFLDDSTVPVDEWQAQVESQLSELFSSPATSPDISAYSERVLAPWAFVHPYLHERGVDSATASALQIGWREDDNRITIPHFWRGKLVGWQARAIPDRPGQWPGTAVQHPKYRSTSGFPKADTLYYNHSRPFPSGGTVVVVESPLSVIKSVALGLPLPVVATFGAKVSATQIRILQDFDEVIVWADADPAGDGMARKLAREMYRKTTVGVVRPDPGRDMADCERLEEMEAKIAGAEPALVWV